MTRVKSDKYDFNNDTVYIPIDTITNQGNKTSSEYHLEFDKSADFLIKLHGASDSHIFVDRYYDAFNYYFVESRTLSDFPVPKKADKKNSGVFDRMMMCYGYNMKIKGTGDEIPDRAYETGMLLYGNGNPSSKEYASLTDFCYGEGGVELRIPWQLLNVMDPSEKQQIADFWEEQVITSQSYKSFSLGFGLQKSDEKLSVKLNGDYSYKSWTMPTWHERLKPSYSELQKYLKKYREEKQ